MCEGEGEELLVVLHHFLVPYVVRETPPSTEFPILMNPHVWILYDLSQLGADPSAFPRPEAIRAAQDAVLVWRHSFLVEVLSRLVQNLVRFLFLFKYQPGLLTEGQAKEICERCNAKQHGKGCGASCDVRHRRHQFAFAPVLCPGTELTISSQL